MDINSRITALFKGRVGRQNFVFAILLLLVAHFIINYALGMGSMSLMQGSTAMFGLLAAAVSFLISIAFAVVSFGLAARRFHDIGKSGWFALIMIVPLVNLIAVIVLALLEGDEGPNEHGDPEAPSNNVIDALLNRGYSEQTSAESPREDGAADAAQQGADTAVRQGREEG